MVYLQRFEAGRPVAMDSSIFEGVIGPCVVSRKPELRLLKIKMSDGGTADCYCDESDLGGVMFSQFERGEVVDLIARAANALGASVMLQEGAVLVARQEQLAHLPDELREDALVVELTGHAILHEIHRH